MRAHTVSVVDGDPASGTAVREMLAAMNLSSAVYRCGQQFLENFNPREPGCVILEVRIPGASGLQIQEELIARGATQPVIFLAEQATLSIAVRAMRLGALHFLEKPFRENELWDAVREAIRLDECRRELQHRRRLVGERMATLTEDERRLAEMIVAGKSNRDISASLGVCIRTVELRRSRMMKKLRLKNVSQLVQLLWASRNGHAPVGPDGPLGQRPQDTSPTQRPLEASLAERPLERFTPDACQPQPDLLEQLR